jgi:hypothetical protein
MLTDPSASPTLDPLQSMMATFAAVAAAGDGASRPIDGPQPRRPRNGDGYSPVAQHVPAESAS